MSMLTKVEYCYMVSEINNVINCMEKDGWRMRGTPIPYFQDFTTDSENSSMFLLTFERPDTTSAQNPSASNMQSSNVSNTSSVQNSSASNTQNSNVPTFNAGCDNGESKIRLEKD